MKVFSLKNARYFIDGIFVKLWKFSHDKMKLN